MKKRIQTYWYWGLIGIFLVSVAVVYICFGEGSYIEVHDNLDLFVAQMQMMKNTNSFFGEAVEIPFLGGISRDNLPSELSLYTLLYVLLPSFAAYVAGYLLKVVISVGSIWLLAGDWYGESFSEYKPLAVLFGFTYGILNLFPAFGIPFASLPLVIYLLRRIYRRPSIGLYLALFCYPFVSYFSYFGFFILAYLVVAIFWLWIHDRRLSRALTGALMVLAAGYMVFEYRLFKVMLFGEEETIRSTMVESDLSAGELLTQAMDVWKYGMFHVESLHHKLVLWVCVIYFIYRNGRYLWEKRGRQIVKDPFNFIMLVLVFNSLVYGIYYWGAFRRLVETLIPQLEGFQFNRTIFFSPFFWYAAFFIILQRISDAFPQSCKQFWIRIGTYGLALVSAAIILFTPTKYNDLYTTCHNKALELLKGKEADAFSYGEFYSTQLFQKIKEEIGYQGEWAAAYGFHPAVLEYNGIATLDGYLGFYAQQYKEDFRKIIAPALERVEASRIYYDDWGARAYLYSGTDLSVVSATKTFTVTDQNIYMDTEAFVQLGGTYLFSRIELTNAKEAGLIPVGRYSGKAFTVYLYRAER